MGFRRSSLRLPQNGHPAQIWDAIEPNTAQHYELMESSHIPSRSRFGCATCRRKHRKCDEQRPVCNPCKVRGLECGYQVTLKWADSQSINTFDASLRQKNKRTKRASCSSGPSVPATPVVASPHPSHDDNRSDALPSLRETAGPSSQHYDTVIDFANSGDGLGAATTSPAEIERTPNVWPESGVSPLDEIRWLELRSLDRQDDDQGHGSLQHDGYSSHRSETFHDEQRKFSDFPSALSPQNTRHVQQAQSALSPADSEPWVINNIMSTVLSQLFEDPGDEIAFHYYFKRVCSCIPAYDSPQNPYRKLALVSLSYPVILHGIISVSTSHMHNYGRSSEALVSSRQARALKSLRSALGFLVGNKSHGDSVDDELRPFVDGGGIFSVLSARLIALAAVMMQTSSCLMSGIGNVEVHMKCALEFMRDLGYLWRPATPVFGRLLVQRFAMVDVVLAHLRFRRPLAPLDFFMYNDHEQVDHEEPSFREMQGCPQRVLGFLAQIAWLSAELTETVTNIESRHAEIQSRAYGLETEMRVWGHKYYDAVVRSSSTASAHADLSVTKPASGKELSNPREALDVVSECFYWTAHILLLRRVFLDPTKSGRVQLIRRHVFRLINSLEVGCGPDSSLPFPFYMAAREAVTLEDRDWVRQKHITMMETHRDCSREYMMASTEKIWEKAVASDSGASDSMPWSETSYEGFIRKIDREASYFMF